MYRRKTAFLLAASISIGLLASCGGDTTNDVDTDIDTDTTSADTTSAEETTKPDIKASLVTKDFGGTDFSFLLWENSQIAVEEEDGDIINDAVYRRNSTVEEMYNVNFVYDVREGSSESGKPFIWMKTLRSSVLAGDDSYDLAGGYGYVLASVSLEGVCSNLCEISSIDFSDSWWATRSMEQAMIGDKVYMSIGEADPLYYDSLYAVYFNKRIAEDIQAEDLYQTVRDGKWTLDKMIEISSAASSDINGDGEMDENDRYGLLVGWTMAIDAFIPAFDIEITGKDADGIPYLMPLSERYTDAQKKLDAFVHSKDAWYEGGLGVHVSPFMSGQGLFLTESIGKAHIMREMRDDFGILPYPKYDEAQENYQTYICDGNTTGFSIPITADAEKSGMILNALNALGQADVRPEYYDRALKGKAARDDDSVDMLDIIFNSISDDFTQFYAYCFGDQESPWMMMRGSILNKKELASLWASKQAKFDNTMEKLIDELK